MNQLALIDRPGLANPFDPFNQPVELFERVAQQAAGRESSDVINLLSHIQHLPNETAMLGISKDGYPVLFDLADPKPGSILAAGDLDAQPINLAKMLFFSLIARHTPDEVKFVVLTANIKAWDYSGYPEGNFILDVTEIYKRDAGQWILRAADWTESRRHGGFYPVPIVLIVDGLDYISGMDPDVRLNFDWLLKEGPHSKIWPFVTICSDRIKESMKLINQFRTRILGRIIDPSIGLRISGDSAASFQKLSPGVDYKVRIAQQWIEFSLPAIS